jgi:hypothetical protein
MYCVRTSLSWACRREVRRLMAIGADLMQPALHCPHPTTHLLSREEVYAQNLAQPGRETAHSSCTQPKSWVH